MPTKNNPHKVLLNDDVLNFSVCQIKNLLNLDSAPNSIYGDKTIIYHLFNAAASQTSINQVSTLSTDAPSEGTIRYRLHNMDSNQLQ
jgi:putative transposase